MMHPKCTPFVKFQRKASVGRAILVFMALLFMNAGSVKAQPIPCPPNIDFETGSFQNWTLFIGGWPGTNVTWGAASSTPAAGRHEIMAGTATDLYGSFPVVAPGGGTYSLKLGNANTGSECERARYYIHVPAGQAGATYSFIYKYAVVFEDPSHPVTDQPKFLITAYDSATGAIVPCSEKTYIAGSNIPGFSNSPIGSNVRYLPWTSGSVNLSGMQGKTIIVDFETYDCSQGAHFGYGYVDMISCGEFKAVIAQCDLAGSGVTFSAPPGYQSYDWYDQNYTTQVGSGQVFSIIPPLTPTYYNVVMIPYAGVGCPDTLHTRYVANITADASPDTLCYLGNQSIPLSVAVQGGVGPLTYAWTGPDLSCNDCVDPIATPSGSQVYTIKVSDSNGCYRMDTLSFMESLYEVDAGADIVTCVGTPVTINATALPSSPDFIYQWSPTLDLSNPQTINPVLTPQTVGTNTYVITVDSAFCRKSDSLVIRVLPNDFEVRDSTICDGAVFQIVGTGDTAFTYHWSPVDGLSDSTIVNPFVTADTTRIYTVTASYPTCPTIVKSVKIEVQPIPYVNMGPDTSKCEWDLLPLTAQVSPSGYPDYTYQWRYNSGLSSLNYPSVIFSGKNDTMLYVEVSTPNNCIGRDSMIVTVHEGNFASNTLTDTAICPGGVVQMHISGGVGYQWEPALYLDDSSSADAISTPITNVDYTIFVVDEFGCLDTMYTSIRVHPSALVDLGDSVVLYPGEQVALNPKGNGLYFHWWPAVGLSATDVANPIAAPTVETRYFVQGITEAGCVAIDSIDIYVKEESLLDMPNAFTPGASLNNTLRITKRGIATLKSFRIYNRWGAKVFETSDINEGWDGKLNGTPQPMGVYIYTVDANTSTGKPFQKQGNVTLIR